MSDTYTPPDSNPDPYSTTTTSPPIDLSTLPRPLPILGPLTGYTPTAIAHGIQTRLASVSQTISRPLTPDETTALTYHCAKSSSIASYGPTLGIATGAYRTWATRQEYRWPFFGKIISDELGTGFWDGEKMRVNGKEILAGVSKEGKANILHTARGMAYVTIALAIVPVFVSGYAAAVAGTSEMRDQRLKSVTREMMAAVRADRDERIARIKGQRGGQTTTMNPNAPADQGSEVWKERRERMSGRVEKNAEAGPGDDMSPTGGAMLDYGIDMEQGDMSDSPQPSPSPSPFQRRQPPRSPSSPTPSSDPTSPTSNRGMLDDTFPTSDSSDATGLSTWERIRQQTTSGETASPSPSSSPSSSTVQQRRGGRNTLQQQQQQEDGSGGGDEFTFSREEEERGYARAEAQREFDERLERERRGGSFGGNE